MVMSICVIGTTECLTKSSSDLQIADEYLDRLQALFEDVRDNHFAIGDLLVELVDMHDSRRVDVINYIAGRLAISPTTLYDYENTARRWTVDKRLEYPLLDWTVYRNADPVEDKELLDRCVDEGWNATKFKENKYPELVSPPSLIMRMVRSAEKIIENQVPPFIYSEILDIKTRLIELYNQLGG